MASPSPLPHLPHLPRARARPPDLAHSRARLQSLARACLGSARCRQPGPGPPRRVESTAAPPTPSRPLAPSTPQPMRQSAVMIGPGQSPRRAVESAAAPRLHPTPSPARAHTSARTRWRLTGGARDRRRFDALTAQAGIARGRQPSERRRREKARPTSLLLRRFDSLTSIPFSVIDLAVYLVRPPTLSRLRLDSDTYIPAQILVLTKSCCHVCCCNHFSRRDCDNYINNNNGVRACVYVCLCVRVQQCPDIKNSLSDSNVRVLRALKASRPPPALPRTGPRRVASSPHDSGFAGAL